ncbi:MAG: DUF3011 domain-containing protein [Chlorobia bacterium]|nr:DUF3011 domain-containing protein [Fimbriimonadaceae bacterium]
MSVLALTAISALAFMEWKKITIESNNGNRVYKRVDFQGRVRMVKQLSDKPCIQGRTWGSDSNGIWVDDGCRATFEYETDGRGNNDSWKDILHPSSGFDMRRVKVESDGGREYKRIDTSGGVKLVKRLSDAPCTMGRTWGYDRDGVWVDDGCRAEFEVRVRNNDRPGRPGDFGRPGNNDNGRFPGAGGVPNWAIGQWRGQGQASQGYTVAIRRDGTLTILKRGLRSSGDRGVIRGSQVQIGNDTYRLERVDNDEIRFNSVSSKTGTLRFLKQ